MNNNQLIVDLDDKNLFQLKCLVKATEIQCSAHYDFETHQFMAFTTENADIILYLRKRMSLPVFKRILWFQTCQKEISALCFDFSGSYLLSVSRDGSLHIIPALALIDEHYVPDKRWNTMDVTSFPSIISQPAYSRPTAVIWWHDSSNTDIGIVGTECGEIMFVNLDSGLCIYIEHINEDIAMLHVCEDKSNNSFYLLITTRSKQQWRLMLEERRHNLLKHSDSCKFYKDDQFTDGSFGSPGTFASTRSKLQVFKQRSVEKFAILKQKLVETKSENSGQSACGAGCNNASATGFDACSSNIGTAVTPELLPKGIFLEPQIINFSQRLYTSYDLMNARITFCGPDLCPIPLPEYKVPVIAENIIFTNRFFFILDANRQTVYVVSSQLSPTYENVGYKVNPECVMAHFCFEDNKEVVRAIYKVTDYQMQRKKLFEDMNSIYTVPNNMQIPGIDLPAIDTVIIITNRSVYKIVLRTSLTSVFMDMVLTKDEVEEAKIMAFTFGINSSQLLECAADILLVNNELSRAVNLYRFAKCRLLKTVLKFASVGNTFEVLNCLTHCLNSPSVTELSTATRMHFSNLCVLAFIEVTLRVPILGLKDNFKDFVNFLMVNKFYDEILVAKIAGQTCLWEIMHYLSTKRGLSGQMLNILIRMMETNDLNLLSYGLLICLSEPSLMQAMLINSDLGKSHVIFTIQHISEFHIFVLQRLLTLYDPTNPVLRPRLVRYKASQTTCNSQINQCDSTDLADDLETTDSLVGEIIETFLMVLLTLIYKKLILKQYSIPVPMRTFQLEDVIRNKNSTHADFRRRFISGGYSHVSLIRNGYVFTWGSCARGCLGTGPTVLKHGAPRPLLFFRKMKLEVLSVSCGRYHTLTVTNNGIYTWGSSQYGQLGIAELSQCSTPVLITALAEEIVTDAVAGQYHSVALTFDGRVFTWGWGVHGQLGHGNTDEKHTPTLVTSLLGTCVRYVNAGYAHTLALSTEGVVYAFGCNVFGQLGTGNITKSSIPIKISLMPEKITLIATGYFHNLAVSQTNRLYIWGASPQMLRIQAQAHKSRTLHRKSFADNQRCPDNFQKQENRVNAPLCVDDITNNDVEATAHCKNAQAKFMNNDVASSVKGSVNTNIHHVSVRSFDEAQPHLKPCLVDTTLVKGQIVQISAGCHHSALVTQDGSLYTWGRNIDGQIGNGTRREIVIPTQLCYNPAFIFSQVPPRHNNRIRDDLKMQPDEDIENPMTIERNDNIKNKTPSLRKNVVNTQGHINPTIKTVEVCCGYDYTLAIQPEGTVLAWGNNSRAQLGRMPIKDAKDGDDKLVLLKSSKRVVRIPHISHVALDTPIQVPDIPTPIISYQNYDVTSLAQCIRPLSLIEKSPGDLTLHYVLEKFMGLYDSAKIMEKCSELENYQACAKIAALQHNLPDAFCFQLKALFAINRDVSNKLISKDLTEIKISNFGLKESVLNYPAEESSSACQHKMNTELFNKQVEKNLIESVEDCIIKNQIKIRSSKSLNNLQFFEQELFNFDCQGAPEEMCTDHKCDETFLNLITGENVKPENMLAIGLSLDRNYGCQTVLDNAPVIDPPKITLTNSKNTTTRLIQIPANDVLPEKVLRSHKNNITNEALKLVKDYLCEVESETTETKYRILESAIEFWAVHGLSIQSLENVFEDYIHTIFYPLGLLMFCSKSSKNYLYKCQNKITYDVSAVVHLFSLDFCLRVSSLLVQYMYKGQSMSEYIQLLSFLAADNYGPPLLGYPGSSTNCSSEQMMQGVISTISLENYEPRSFIHINESDTVNHLLEIADSAMVFTCGHHFPCSSYKSEIIPQMEMEILTSRYILLPCTAQFLDKLLQQKSKPEILCPLCIPRALETTINKS